MKKLKKKIRKKIEKILDEPRSIIVWHYEGGRSLRKESPLTDQIIEAIEQELLGEK